MQAEQQSERERFEAWAVGILGDNPTWRESGPCELAWQSWQARAALSHPSTLQGCSHKWKVPLQFDYLAEFYKVDTVSELIAAQAYHVEKLQHTIRERGLLLPAAIRVREG